MDGASHSRRRSDHNISYNQTPQHRYNNSERTDFVGITISDDFSQKQLPLLPIMNNASSPSHPSQQKQIPLNSQRQNSYPPIPNPIQQEPPEGHSRRRLDNYVPNSPSGHYTLLQTPTSQHQNVQPHQRSLSGHQLQQSPQQSQSYSPHSHNKTHQPSHTNSRQHRRPSHSQLQQSSGQQPPPPPQLAPPIQIGYKSTYSPNSQPSSPNAVTTSQNKPSQQLNQSRTDFGGEYRTTAFRKVRSISDLRPQPARRVESSKVIVSTLKALTIYLTSTYQNINPHFRYDLTYNPRRVLTKPSKGVKNDGFDNEDCDYILYVNDILGSEEGQKYLILDVLGQGTFGQVVKCQNLKTKDIVAVKVVKNKPAYFNQSMMEVTILELLNQTWDNQDQHHILRLLDTFIHRRHLCLVFELLSVNLYELIKQNQFRGLSTNLVRVFTAQLLDALTVLNEARIIHCDLKPENVLLKKCVKSSLESPTIKVIDFGSACHERQTVYTYIQSRFYRSPEVLLGLPYSSSIDMWSLGCIAVELFLGLPLFPGSSEYNQVSRIVEMMGIPPAYMIEVGKTAHEYFDRYMNEHGQKKYRLKSMEQYMREHNTVEQPSKRYFSAGTLPEIVQSYPIMRKGLTQKDIDKEMQNRLAFIDFVQGLLNLNPIERWSPQQAKLHPFITGEKFTGKFTPPMQIKATNKMGTSTQPISSNSSNSTPNLMQIPSPIKYKASNNSPKVQPKNPLIIAHDMPTLKLSHVPASNSHVPPSRQKPQQQQQISNKMSSLAPKSSISSLRPRASTIGNIQIPPQIQRAAALVTPGSVGASPVEHSKKDPRRLPQNYPHLQLLQERDQQHELPQFSVIVDSNENNRASDQTNSPNNNTLSGGNKVDIRKRDDVWQDKEGRNHQDERLPKDERNKSPTVSSNDDKITDNNTENDTLKSMIMPGSMPNGAAGFGISSGGLDDSILGTSGPPLHLTQQYHQKSLQQLQQMQIEQSKNNTPNSNGSSNNKSWQSSSSSLSSSSSRPVLPQHHHYQQSGLRHPSPLPVSVNVVSPIMTQAHPRPSNFRSSPSYNNQSPSSFRNSPSHYTTPSTSPYMTHSQHHQLPLPATHPQPKQQQSSSSIASSGNYHHNLALPANYDQHNLHSQQSNRNHRISPSTSPSYPPNNPSSGYGISSSPTYELPSYFQQINHNVGHHHHHHHHHQNTSSQSRPPPSSQRTSPNQMNPIVPNNKPMTNDVHHHNNDQKYNNRREINALPYQMA